MAEPLIYVGTHRIKDGAVPRARAAAEDLAAFIEANHPSFLHFAITIDADEHAMTVLQVHPDEASMALHVQLAGDRIAAAYEFLEATTRIDIFGTPSPGFVDQITAMSAGAPVHFHEPSAGFSRLVSLPV